MEKFRNLHFGKEPLLLANVWDVHSAVKAEKLGYKAVGSSSAAMATMLGYKDGEDMDFELLLLILKRIISKITIPISVDIEAGYSSKGHQIAKNIKRLAELGVEGINIEDSLVVNGKRSMLPAHHFVETLEAIRDHLRTDNISVFINARTDGYITGHKDALTETLSRAAKYESAGVDGIFVPCLTEESDIKSIVAKTSLPLNVMCMPELPSFDRLKELGVRRISMGNFVQTEMHARHEELLFNVLKSRSFNPVFS